MALTAKQRRFVIEYPIDSNGTQAAIRAGYSENGARVQASELLANPNIQKAIEEREEDLARAAGITVEKILRYWDQIAEADPSELIKIEIRCCRHCYGAGHEYEWNEWEFKQACDKARAHRCGKNCEDPCSRSIPPFPAGGLGFNPRRPPVEDCPNCNGEGEQFTKVADMRYVSPSAARLIAAVEVSDKGAIKIKMRDQTDAVRNLAQFRGMLINRSEVAGPGGGAIPIATASINLSELSDEQLLVLATGGGTIGGSSDTSLVNPLEPLTLEAGSNP